MNGKIARWHTIINRLQALLLIVAMFGLLALLGWLIWGGDSIIWLLLFGALLVMFNPAISPQLIMRLYRAEQLIPAQAPVLFRIINELSRRAELPNTPNLYYLPSSMVNAFAVGNRRQAAIGLTDGLLNVLDTREVIAILAHEISHIQHNDLWLMGMADLFSRVTSLLSLFGQLLLLVNLPLILLSGVGINWLAILILILAPALSSLAQLGLSRVREFNADLSAVRLSGDPEGLAMALSKVERQVSLVERILLPGRRTPNPSILRTHPPTEARIRRLLDLQWDFQKDLFHGREMEYRPFTEPIKRPPVWHITGLWH